MKRNRVEDETRARQTARRALGKNLRGNGAQTGAETYMEQGVTRDQNESDCRADCDPDRIGSETRKPDNGYMVHDNQPVLKRVSPSLYSQIRKPMERMAINC